jgi:hypothetical protein
LEFEFYKLVLNPKCSSSAAACSFAIDVGLALKIEDA